MKKIILFIVLIIFVFYLGFKVKWSKLFSHGVLSEVHKELEKSGECNACHTKGQKLDFDKCLLCHEKIKEKIESNSGLHAKASKECVNCHSEHHGESYNLIHLDIERFDHNSTGWPLNGKHALLRCTVCHSKESYLLDKNRCRDCHYDIHLGQLDTDCDKCHNEENFKTITYEHVNMDKGPKGKHMDLACRDCHEVESTTSPSEKGILVKYTGTKFLCNKCHEDPHDGEYGLDCSECHNQITFEKE
ncbi:MAG: hypothetical protein ACMUIU_02450 [bacterium]